MSVIKGILHWSAKLLAPLMIVDQSKGSTNESVEIKFMMERNLVRDESSKPKTRPWSSSLKDLVDQLGKPVRFTDAPRTSCV